MDSTALTETLNKIIFTAKEQNGSMLDEAEMIYDEVEFNEIIDRECVRADHYEQGFVLVTFKVEAGSQQFKELRSALAKRLRLSDVTGWVNPHHLGVLLADMEPSEGAQVFINSMSYLMSFEQSTLPVHGVHSYPHDWMPHGDDAWKQAAKASAAPQAEQAELALSRGAVLENPPKLDKLMRHAMPGWKRALDIIGASFGILMLSPLFLFVAAYIKIVSPGPIFFRQPRVGFLGTEFIIWKFRTMEHNADIRKHQHYINELLKNGQPMYKLEDADPQIIRYGNVLRKTGIDEFPQLINVLKGEMSLVGPRPDVIYAAKNYKSWYHARSDAYPGLTGLWQVSGKNNTSYERMMSLDIYYSRNISFWTDVKIIFNTPLSILAQVKEAVFQPKNPLSTCTQENAE